MGCDGGTIPRRDELVRIKKKPEQKDKEAELAYRWRHCSIRQLPLQAPIVSCGLGRLYSKEAVLEGLLDRSILPESAAHIKNLKDVKNINLSDNPAFEGDKAKNGGYIDDGKSPFICPVIGLEMNGKYKFCFLWNCGCVMSERAIKEIKTYICHKCQQPFSETDIVVMNAQDDDLELMKENINKRKAQRKSKKRLVQIVKTDESKSDEILNKKINNECEEILNQRIKSEIDEEISNKKFKKDSTEVSNTKIKKEAEEVVAKKINKERKHKIVSNKSRPKQPEDPAYKKAKEDYSVAEDPKASEVLKSIFTTHKTASEQDRAHWITYNPFYN